VNVEIHVFLTSALVGGEWLASRPRRFIPEEKVHGTHWIKGWVSPKAGLDETAPAGTQNSDLFAVLPIASRYTYWAIAVRFIYIKILFETFVVLRNIYRVTIVFQILIDFF
jgi:hypothetical protein